MITSSYINPEMVKMHNDVKGKDLIFLNECGLDPGIDIMGTMKIVHEAKRAGYKVVSYESYCGGIPVAEQADNPLGYKFSWNPGAGIKASRNTATFLKNGKKIVTNSPLKCAVNRDDFSVSMKLESYPNRDSLVF
jgi:saccharopine dehydrogenase (NADP+, L-glutamate forming)